MTVQLQYCEDGWLNTDPSVAARINGTLSPKCLAQSVSPIEGIRTERTLGLGVISSSTHRTHGPGSGVRASYQATWLLCLSPRTFMADVILLAQRATCGALCVLPCHILSSSVGRPAEPAEVRLEPGSVSHPSSRFFLLRPPAISLRHSTLYRPRALWSRASPGPPATPHGHISIGNDSSPASGSSARVLPAHFPTGSHVTRVYRLLPFCLPGFWGPGLQPAPSPVCLLDKAR